MFVRLVQKGWIGQKLAQMTITSLIEQSLDGSK